MKLPNRPARMESYQQPPPTSRASGIERTAGALLTNLTDMYYYASGGEMFRIGPRHGSHVARQSSDLFAPIGRGWQFMPRLSTTSIEQVTELDTAALPAVTEA